MRKEVISLFTAVFMLGVGMASALPGDAYAASKDKKEAVACGTITDTKKKQKCMKAEAKKAAAEAKKMAACKKIKDAKKQGKCLEKLAKKKN